MAKLHVSHAASGAILGGAVGDAFAAARERRWPNPVLGGVGELATAWSDVTRQALADAECILRGEAAPFDLAPTSAHMVAIADHVHGAGPSLLVDGDAIAVYEVVRSGLGGDTADDESSSFAGALQDAFADGRDPVVVGTLAGLRFGATGIPSRWITYVHGPGPRRTHRLRDLLRLSERLLGDYDQKFPPDPPRRLGPREVMDGVWAANLYSVKRFAADHPDAAIISMCPIGDLLDTHRVRRQFLIQDLPSRTANPRLTEVVDELVETIGAFRDEGLQVLVHCHHGVSRTGLALRAWMMHTEGLGEADASAEIGARWPRLSLSNRGFTRELQARESP